MTIKLLALGATGYIGGAALHGIYNDDPALFDVRMAHLGKSLFYIQLRYSPSTGLSVGTLRKG